MGEATSTGICVLLTCNYSSKERRAWRSGARLSCAHATGPLISMERRTRLPSHAGTRLRQGRRFAPSYQQPASPRPVHKWPAAIRRGRFATALLRYSVTPPAAPPHALVSVESLSSSRFIHVTYRLSVFSSSTPRQQPRKLGDPSYAAQRPISPTGASRPAL
jgi:hypothetical protein